MEDIMAGANTVTTKDLAASLAKEHQMSKRAGRMMLDEMHAFAKKRVPFAFETTLSGG